MKKEIHILLRMGELLYDIENTTHLIGLSRVSGDNYGAVSNMQADDKTEVRNQILRFIDNAFKEIKITLNKFLCDTGSAAGDNSLIDGSSDLEMLLLMPENYNPALRDTLNAAAHQYVVNKTIAEWFNITNKDDAAAYYTLAEGNKQQVLDACSCWVGKVRRPKTPF